MAKFRAKPEAQENELPWSSLPCNLVWQYRDEYKYGGSECFIETGNCKKNGIINRWRAETHKWIHYRHHGHGKSIGTRDLSIKAPLLQLVPLVFWRFKSHLFICHHFSRQSRLLKSGAVIPANPVISDHFLAILKSWVLRSNSSCGSLFPRAYRGNCRIFLIDSFWNLFRKWRWNNFRYFALLSLDHICSAIYGWRLFSCNFLVTTQRFFSDKSREVVLIRRDNFIIILVRWREFSPPSTHERTILQFFVRQYR